ncbi:beta-N-acetylhexosaminidase [Halosquirtibacter xylanolyticus]|uniref:beta-N-acetylhexosaminidase n=1 Tax=Halosquirtibacter xylanolyticus TaxID=3374599 RepID=UPI0037496874|nr:beta-N-acetylhexosaminidase [Prolixibacteraceae bacterium]
MRKRYVPHLVLICLGMMISIGATAVNKETSSRIVPQPNSITRGSETVIKWGDPIRVIYDKELSNEKSFLQQNLFEGYEENVVFDIRNTRKLKKQRKGNYIEITIDKSNKFFKEEGAYILEAKDEHVLITAADARGIFYGIQSLKQLSEDGIIESCVITDSPRFQWRGMMLDEARFFQGKREVKKILDEMAYLKMNRFHWHLTDDAGWRIEIKKYPKLTSVGAYRKDSEAVWWKSGKKLGRAHSGYYTQEDIKEVIAYAKARHITIIPEIEMPGHAAAAIAAYPWLTASKKQIPVPTRFGKFKEIYNVSDPRVIEFIHDVLEEVFNLFPSKVVHVGGDEVLYDSWNESKEVQRYMADQKLKTPSDLQIYFTNNLSKFFEQNNRNMMGWNDILGDDIHGWQSKDNLNPSETLSQSTIVHFWKGDPKLIKKTLERGYKVVNAYHIFTYLDYKPTKLTLQKMFNYDPVPKGISEDLAKNIMGVSGQMWTEWCPTNCDIERQIFPRLAALAEIGWTNLDQKHYQNFVTQIPRLEKRWYNKEIRYDRETKY